MSFLLFINPGTTYPITDTQSIDQKFLNQVISIIEKHISLEELNVEFLMCALHLSRSHLHRKLKKLTGLSTTEFIRTIRIKRAAQMLESQTDNISQIAYKVGFSNLSYFSKCFKKQFNQSPSEFMVSLRDK